MPSKVTPLAPLAGAGHGSGHGAGHAGAGHAGAGQKASNKSGIRPRLFDTKRFKTRFNLLAGKADMATLARQGETGESSLASAVLVLTVGLTMLALGIFLVAYGDDNYVVDLMVLGGLVLVFGVGVVLGGAACCVRPFLRWREMKRWEAMERREAAAAAAAAAGAGPGPRGVVVGTDTPQVLSAATPEAFSVVPRAYPAVGLKTAAHRQRGASVSHFHDFENSDPEARTNAPSSAVPPQPDALPSRTSVFRLESIPRRVTVNDILGDTAPVLGEQPALSRSGTEDSGPPPAAVYHRAQSMVKAEEGRFVEANDGAEAPNSERLYDKDNLRSRTLGDTRGAELAPSPPPPVSLPSSAASTPTRSLPLNPSPNLGRSQGTEGQRSPSPPPPVSHPSSATSSPTHSRSLHQPSSPPLPTRDYPNSPRDNDNPPASLANPLPLRPLSGSAPLPPDQIGVDSPTFLGVPGDPGPPRGSTPPVSHRKTSWTSSRSSTAISGDARELS